MVLPIHSNAQRQQMRDDFMEAKHGSGEDPNSKYNRYTTHLADFRDKQKLDAVSQREMNLQGLKNTGQVDVARTTGEGYAEQQRLRNIGQRDVTGMEQVGLDTRDKRANELGRRELAGNQFKMLQELGATNDLRENPINFGQRFNDFNTSSGVGNGVGQTQSQTQNQYTPVERANGMTGYYDNNGKLAYTDLTNPDSVQTKSGMKYSGLRDLKTNDLDGNGDGSANDGIGYNINRSSAYKNRSKYIQNQLQRSEQLSDYTQKIPDYNISALNKRQLVNQNRLKQRQLQNY